MGDEQMKQETQQLRVSMQQLQDKLSVCEKDKKEFASQRHRAKQDLTSLETQNRKLDDDVARLSHEVHQLHYQVGGVVM